MSCSADVEACLQQLRQAITCCSYVLRWTYCTYRDHTKTYADIRNNGILFKRYHHEAHSNSLLGMSLAILWPTPNNTLSCVGILRDRNTKTLADEGNFVLHRYPRRRRRCNQGQENKRGGLQKFPPPTGNPSKPKGNGPLLS